MIARLLCEVLGHRLRRIPRGDYLVHRCSRCGIKTWRTAA